MVDTAHPLLAELAGAAEDLWERLHPLLPGLQVEVRPVVDSTNLRLMQQAREGDLTPALLVAVEQTAGRGRQGRLWHAVPGDALTCSLRLPVPAGLDAARLSGLSIAVGVALAEALGEPIRLKWPNDLCRLLPRPDAQVDEADAAGLGKLGGILIESMALGPSRVVVIGVGLNLRGAAPAGDAAGEASGRPGGPDASDGALAPLPWASLEQAGLPGAPGPALQAVATALVQAWQIFTVQGLGPFLPRFAERDALAGRDVQVRWPAAAPEPAAAAASDLAGGGVRGVAGGLDEQGHLLVHTARGLLVVASGDVSVRPVPLP